MAKYVYTAMDINGNKVNGELFAESKEGIITELKLKKLFPMSVTALNAKKTNSRGLEYATAWHLIW